MHPFKDPLRLKVLWLEAEKSKSLAASMGGTVDRPQVGFVRCPGPVRRRIPYKTGISTIHPSTQLHIHTHRTYRHIFTSRCNAHGLAYLTKRAPSSKPQPSRLSQCKRFMIEPRTFSIPMRLCVPLNPCVHCLMICGLET